VSWIRTSDLPTLERERERESFRNLGKADRSLGYQVGCADHCTTTAFLLAEGDQEKVVYKGWHKEWGGTGVRSREGVWVASRLRDECLATTHLIDMAWESGAVYTFPGHCLFEVSERFESPLCTP
jgi:hypothetical protein